MTPAQLQGTDELMQVFNREQGTSLDEHVGSSGQFLASAGDPQLAKTLLRHPKTRKNFLF